MEFTSKEGGKGDGNGRDTRSVTEIISMNLQPDSKDRQIWSLENSNNFFLSSLISHVKIYILDSLSGLFGNLLAPLKVCAVTWETYREGLNTFGRIQYRNLQRSVSPYACHRVCRMQIQLITFSYTAR